MMLLFGYSDTNTSNLSVLLSPTLTLNWSRARLCVYTCVWLRLMYERRTHGRGGSGEGQTQEHQEGDELVARLHVGHGEVTVVAAVAHHGRGQHICQLQEVEGHQRGEDDGELDGHTRGARTRQRQI